MNRFTTCGFAALTLALVGFTAAGCAVSSDADRARGGGGSRGAYSPIQRPRADVVSPTLDEESGLSEYLQYAALNNPRIYASYLGWVAAVKRAEQAGYLPEPRLDYGIYAKQAAGRQDIRITQMFPWFGTLPLMKDVAGSESLAALSGYESQINRQFSVVTKSYADYYFLGRRIEILRDNLSLMESIEANAQARYAAGRASYSDIIRAQVELGRMENDLDSLLDLRSALVSRLNSALGRPAHADLPLPASLPDSIELPEDETLMALMSDENPELAALARRREAGEAALELAGKRYYPDIMVGLEYMDMRGSEMMMDDDLMIMAGITLPIWRKKYRAGEEEARAKIEMVDSEIEGSRLSLEAGLQSALFEARDARRRMDLYTDLLIPKAEESLAVTTAAYEAGEVGFQAVLDAWRALFEFRLALENARTEELKNISEIELTTGLALLQATGEARDILIGASPTDEGE